jgi:hypothetical protein
MILRRHQQPTTSVPTKPRPRAEATRARQEAEEHLAETRAQTPRYRALAETLRAIRERNHLAEGIEAALQTRRGT